VTHFARLNAPKQKALPPKLEIPVRALRVVGQGDEPRHMFASRVVNLEVQHRVGSSD
jgi:hypothetical protein